jgi:tRNA-dihydrouridine synthase
LCINGDIETPAQLAALVAPSSTDGAAASSPAVPYTGIMCGRAAIRRPWLFAEARALQQGLPYSPPDICETGLLFLDLLRQHQPPEFHLSRARRFFAYFCDNLQFGNYLKTQLGRETTLEGVERVWRGYF